MSDVRGKTAAPGQPPEHTGPSPVLTQAHRLSVAHHPHPATISFMNICVIDVGTSSIRSAVTDGHQVICFRQQRTPPDMPEPGLVEFDAMEMAGVILETATEVINEVGGVDAVAVTNQRGTAMVWNRQTGEPVGPALGWQDLRTVGECLAWQAEGLDLVPNESATKLAYLLDHHDPDRTRDLCFGTVDTWTVWCLSQGASHVVDPSNAAMSGMLADDGSQWSDEITDRLGVPRRCLPEIVDSTGVVGRSYRFARDPRR